MVSSEALYYGFLCNADHDAALEKARETLFEWGVTETDVEYSNKLEDLMHEAAEKANEEYDSVPATPPLDNTEPTAVPETPVKAQPDQTSWMRRVLMFQNKRQCRELQDRLERLESSISGLRTQVSNTACNISAVLTDASDEREVRLRELLRKMTLAFESKVPFFIWGYPSGPMDEDGGDVYERRTCWAITALEYVHNPVQPHESHCIVRIDLPELYRPVDQWFGSRLIQTFLATFVFTGHGYTINCKAGELLSKLMMVDPTSVCLMIRSFWNDVALADAEYQRWMTKPPSIEAPSPVKNWDTSTEKSRRMDLAHAASLEMRRLDKCCVDVD